MPALFEYLDNQIYCHHSRDTNPASLQLYMHAHERMELYYFISGDADFIVEGKLYHLCPGDIMLTRSAEVHMSIMHSGPLYERISIQFDGDVVSSIDKSGVLLRPFLDRALGSQNCYSLSSFPDVDIAACFANFDLPNTPERKRLHIISTLIQLLTYISYRFEKISELERYPNADCFSAQIVDYINKELYSEISLASVAQHFYLSKTHINRVFKAATGTTVGEYIKVKRLLAVRERIIAGDNIYEAAINCGFNDYSAFYRAYRDRFGISPSKTVQH